MAFPIWPLVFVKDKKLYVPAHLDIFITGTLGRAKTALVVVQHYIWKAALRYTSNL